MNARPTPAPRPSAADQLHQIARRVERLAVSGRTDPEQVVVEKLTLARELRQLARSLPEVSHG